MVLIIAPAACATGTRQLLTISPLRTTEQAPHSPSPQPSFVPVRCSCSRRTSNRRSSGWAFKVSAFPLTVQVILLVLAEVSICVAAYLNKFLHHRFGH